MLVEIQYIENFFHFKPRESVREMIKYLGRMNFEFLYYIKGSAFDTTCYPLTIVF